jgi:hypothetical protein
LNILCVDEDPALPYIAGRSELIHFREQLIISVKIKIAQTP